MKRKKLRIKILYDARLNMFYGYGQKQWLGLLWFRDTEKVDGLTSMEVRRNIEWLYEERQRIKHTPKDKLKPRYEYLDK